MLALQKTKTILPAEAGKNCAVVERGLGVEIGLGGPPGRRAVLEFAPEGVEVVASALVPKVEKYSTSRLPGSSR
jgi:hypothetical protein